MPDAAPDKLKRTHGWQWYVSWGLSIYLLAFMPCLIGAHWLKRWGLLDDGLSSLIAILYWPLIELMEYPPVEQFLRPYLEPLFPPGT